MAAHFCIICWSVQEAVLSSQATDANHSETPIVLCMIEWLAIERIGFLIPHVCSKQLLLDEETQQEEDLLEEF